MRLQALSVLEDVHRDVLHGHHAVLPDPAGALRGALHAHRRHAPLHRAQNIQRRHQQEPGQAPGEDCVDIVDIVDTVAVDFANQLKSAHGSNKNKL